MKKGFLIVSIFFIISSIAYWTVFIKSKDVTDENMLVVSSIKNQLKIETAESAKYISDINYTVLKDTMMVSVKTTTVLNPFSSKAYFKMIDLEPDVRFIKIGGKAEPIDKFTDHRIVF